MRIARPVLIVVAAASLTVVVPRAQTGPRATLTPVTSVVHFPGNSDSNSPAIWQKVGGVDTLFVLTSVAGRPSVSSGPDLFEMGTEKKVTITPWPGGGIWMEAVIADTNGTWYGYYHNEVVAAVECKGTKKVIPRIGAAKSTNRGATWQPIGIVLEAPPGSYNCATKNQFFVGGIGDFTVQTDPVTKDLYFYYSEYLRDPAQQGVAVARLAWADRTDPAGKMMVWQKGAWLPPSTRTGPFTYLPGSPIFPTTDPWHDGNTTVGAFWGPSVHWNTFLGKYVMLLNRSKDEAFTQEGIYISYNAKLNDPAGWTSPVKLVDGGHWYPQVIGLDTGTSSPTGTDKTAGEYARFFMGGVSSDVIHFEK